mmetsp:Transcript_30606/g.90769  ORF Transcript_30606/g.90769 Transcript_30606/m.90769 type:complete len:271 (-) Transcript_30606:769-1581(-)
MLQLRLHPHNRHTPHPHNRHTPHPHSPGHTPQLPDCTRAQPRRHHPWLQAAEPGALPLRPGRRQLPPLPPTWEALPSCSGAPQGTSPCAAGRAPAAAAAPPRGGAASSAAAAATARACVIRRRRRRRRQRRCHRRRRCAGPQPLPAAVCHCRRRSRACLQDMPSRGRPPAADCHPSSRHRRRCLRAHSQRFPAADCQCSRHVQCGAHGRPCRAWCAPSPRSHGPLPRRAGDAAPLPSSRGARQAPARRAAAMHARTPRGMHTPQTTSPAA